MSDHSLLRLRNLVTTLTVVVFIGLTTAHAQIPGKVDLEASELQASELIGTPAFAGRTEIGVVSDVSTREDGRIDKIRVRTASSLGFGERTIEIPRSTFTLLPGAVVLHLLPEDVDRFPTAAVESTSAEEK